MVFFKSYPKCFIATLISIFGGVSGLMGVLGLVESFSSGTVGEGIVVFAVCTALFFGLRKLADIIAESKYKRLAAKENEGRNDR